jgi:hypothetical protein
MKASINSLLLLLGVVFLPACKDEFLDRPPIDQITSGNFYKTDAEVMAGTAPLYNIVWFDFNDKAFMAFQEARAGNLQSNDRNAYIEFRPSATDANTLLPGYKSFYKIIAQSNLAYTAIKNSTANLTPSVRATGLGESRFMRGLAYYYLVCNWGEVPIIYDNNAQLTQKPVKNKIEDVWQMVIRDFQFAARNLPRTPSAQGRLTKYSAEGMLARAFLMRAGLNQNGTRNQSDLDSAKFYAHDVVTNSGLQLSPSYESLFESANHNSSNNNPESLFSLQWMPFSQPWGVNNSFQAYVAFESKLTETGDGWGAAQGVSADVVKYFLEHPEDSLRRKTTSMFNGDFYPKLEQKYGGLQYTQTDRSHIKKYVVGSPADNGGKGAFMSAYINTYMLRLAEVYLIYAEAILANNASTSDPEALKYFNAVRTRAGVPTKNSITFSDIFQEKRVETIMEGNAWNEIVRWYYFDPAKAIAYTAAQDKGDYTIELVPFSFPKRYVTTFTPKYFPFTAQTLYLPIPEPEIINAPDLGPTKPSVSFDFSNIKD